MADNSGQNPSAARLQGSREIVHRDLGPRGRHRHLPPTLARKCRTATLCLALALVSAVLLAGGAHDAGAEARRVEGGVITDVPPDSAGVRSFKGIPLPPPGRRTALAPAPAGEAVAGRARCRPVRA